MKSELFHNKLYGTAWLCEFMMEQEREKHKLFTYCILQRCSFSPLKRKAYSTNQEKTITINMQEFQPLCANRLKSATAPLASRETLQIYDYDYKFNT